MGISITNAEVEAMARELASLRNVSVAEAIRQSLEQELARERQAEKSDDPDLYQRLLAISDAAARLPVVSDMTDDEILGYDEVGAPTR
jgi:antitoxin VapB